MRTFILVCLFAVAATAAILPEASYLPPEDNILVENPLESDEIVEVKEAADASIESAALADDGYRYKTVRKLKYRQRRDVSEIVAPEYLPPAEEVSSEYIPPAVVKTAAESADITETPLESAALADDGYRYKTVRKLKYRQRRDVSEIVAPEYLPPAEEVSAENIVPAEVKAAVESADITETPLDSTVLADDGYRYKTVRKLKYRQRRDVSEIVAPEYLPPAEEVSAEYIPPVEVKAAVESADITETPLDSTVLADDGYRYKTVRKLKYRQRRDVSEIVAPEYLPPAKEVSAENIAPAEVKAAAESVDITETPLDSAALADDGYRYKTVRKLKYRQRRDVSEIVAPEYLPPAKEVSAENIAPAEVKAAAESVDITETPLDSAVLADDGYRYKTVRKLKYRQRRNVPEIVAPEYLPPAEEVSAEYIPPVEVKAAVESADITETPLDSTVLADDGYRYKTVRKLKYRQRRDVSEIVAPEYLPPAKEVSAENIAPAEVKAAAESADITETFLDSTVLADDGYRYKTVRKLKFRQRRNVPEIVAPEYLPPAEEVSAEYIPPVEVKAAVESADITETPLDSTVLADDGYRYKTVRKLKYRQRRDVSEIVAPEYLPPAEEVSAENIVPAEVKDAVESAYITETPLDSTVLADDGYRYKTVRKLKYRQRRDVSEIVAPEYLPPAKEVSAENIAPAEVKAAAESVDITETPLDSAVLADDGYHYKTVRKLKYRQRRDVSEIVAPEYLPPAEEVSAENIAPAEVKAAAESVDITETPLDSAVLADDGYHYKTVRKLNYRQRRDVSEIVAPEYLPPAEEVSAENIAPAEVKAAAESADITETPLDSAVLADDGYHYKTVRKLKYRQHLDVSEIIAPEYLPPAEEVSAENIAAAEVKAGEESAEITKTNMDSAVLADDGYHYKTVRKLKYRQRRDVSEIVAPEYLPPAKEVSAENIAPAEVKAAAESVDITETPLDSAVLADDGYHYKTVKKLKYRQRRDVSEIVAPEYLPPAEEVSAENIAPAEVKAAAESADITETPLDSTVLADDGYRYKTVRKLKYRQRRDVSEIVAPEYLPPKEEVSAEYIPPVEVKAAVETADITETPLDSAVLADDGYRYKTVRKLKYRQRRDVSEIIAPEYLPPVAKSTLEYLPPVEEVAEVAAAPVEESAVLADDGYHYKTIRKLKYRS